jgi:hypothetical protein
MLHCCTVDATASQLQGGEAASALCSKQAEEKITTQLCPGQAEAVKGREGLRDETSATWHTTDLQTGVTRYMSSMNICF